MLLFWGSSCLELEFDGLGVRSAVDCSALESLSTPLVVAAGFVSSRKMGGKIGISGLLRLLGKIQHKLDWVCVGLASKPNHRRKRVYFMGLTKFGFGWVSGSDQNSGPCQYSDPGHNSNSGQNLDPSSRLGSNLDFCLKFFVFGAGS